MNLVFSNHGGEDSILSNISQLSVLFYICLYFTRPFQYIMLYRRIYFIRFLTMDVYKQFLPWRLSLTTLFQWNFQRLFHLTCLYIMENRSSKNDIRELVLRCMDKMIWLMNDNLRSGWKIILECLTLSENDPSENISTLGLPLLPRLLDDHLDVLLSPFAADDVDNDIADDTC